MNPNQWLVEHGDYLFRYALVRLRDQHLAEDAVQETFLAAVKGSESFSGNSSARTWLTGILKHKIIDQFRRSQREAPLPEQELAEDVAESGMDDFFNESGHWAEPPLSLGDPSRLAEQKQFLQVLQDCMDRLPAQLARLVLLREIEERENEEICKELEITPTNAWVMLYRARMGVRKCLEINWLGGGRA
jgi:RNA polymerase sigma-70 factor (ECF subfamily)